MAQPVSPECLSDLERDEGCVLTAYPDPRSPLSAACKRLGISAAHYYLVPGWRAISGAPFTIGFGVTGPDIMPGLTWTQAQADNALTARAQATADGLVAAEPWIDSLDEVRRSACINMAYNMGVHGLLGFHNALAALQAGDWASAGANFKDSAWYNQVGQRAVRIVSMIETGQRGLA